ncbi:hypothetical protein [Thalassospira lucentensis]
MVVSLKGRMSRPSKFGIGTVAPGTSGLAYCRLARRPGAVLV